VTREVPIPFIGCPVTPAGLPSGPAGDRSQCFSLSETALLATEGFEALCEDLLYEDLDPRSSVEPTFASNLLSPLTSGPRGTQGLAGCLETIRRPPATSGQSECPRPFEIPSGSEVPFRGWRIVRPRAGNPPGSMP